MRLRVTWHPWVEILNRKWTLDNHPWVWIKQKCSFTYVTMFVPCDSMKDTCKFSALHLQRWLTMKGTLRPQHLCSALRWLQWHCQTNRDKPRLGSWSLWVLTNRWFLGWSGDLSETPGDHRWCACNKEKKTPQNCLTPPSEVKNRQFYARKKKKTKTNVIGQEPSVFCEHTW